MNAKERFIISFIIVLFNAIPNSFGQSLAEKYINVRFAYNPITVKTNGGDYNVTYTNNKGRFSTIYEILSDYKMNQYNIGIGFGKFKGLNHTISFELLNGKIKKGQFGYSIGYNIVMEGDKNDFFIRPAVCLMYGNTSINYEEKTNTDRFITLYGERYEAESASILQTYTSYLVRPSVTFTYLLKQRLGFFLELGYDLDMGKNKSKFEVYFKEYTDAEPKLTNNITDENYTLTTPSGQFSKDRIYNLSCFYWSIGLSLYKSFDYD